MVVRNLLLRNGSLNIEGGRCARIIVFRFLVYYTFIYQSGCGMTRIITRVNPRFNRFSQEDHHAKILR
jgi:hypothetical protein